MSLNGSAKMDGPHFDNACTALANGQCVAIPTETVYGLAADATNGEAVARIFELKNRPTFNPLICHIDGLKMALEYGNLCPVALKLADVFWPGPLTMVVPSAKISPISPLVTAGLDSIGLRHPRGPASELISRFGKPLAAPSANRSGRVSPTTAQHVKDEFLKTDLIVLDCGSCEVGIESTIVKICNQTITLLRPGAITSAMIEQATGIIPTKTTGSKIQAPGMMQSHYAPNSAVILNVTNCEPGHAWLQFGSDFENHPQALNLSKSGNLLEAASNLYGMLKELDTVNAAKICVSPIPEIGIGIAINDRLRRAAAPRKTT